MPDIDYMKALDIAALTLDISSHIEVKALDLKLFQAVLTRDDGSAFEILVRTGDFDLELSLDKNALDKKQFQTWLGKFEFQMEQAFLKNFKIKSSETKQEYKIIIEY